MRDIGLWKPWYGLWIFWIRGNRTFDIHRSRDCHRLSITAGPFCLRWLW